MTNPIVTSLLKKIQTQSETDPYDRRPAPELVDSPQTVIDIKYLIEGLENINRVIQSDMDVLEDSGYWRRLAELDKIINRHLDQRKRLIERHENGPDMLVANLARITVLNTQLTVLRSKTDVERMIRLVKQLNNIETQQSPQMLAANIAHLGGDATESYADIGDGGVTEAGLEILEPTDLGDDETYAEYGDDGPDDYRQDVRARQLEEEDSDP